MAKRRYNSNQQHFQDPMEIERALVAKISETGREELRKRRRAGLEYPTGSIVLATLSKSSRDFIILRELSALEIVTLRKKFNLEPVFQ